MLEMLNPLTQTDFPALSAAYTTEAHTADFAPGPSAVWLFSTTAAYVEVGNGAVATIGSLPIPANWPVLLKVPPDGRPWRVSAVQVAAGGTVYAKPVNRV